MVGATKHVFVNFKINSGAFPLFLFTSDLFGKFQIIQKYIKQNVVFSILSPSFPRKKQILVVCNEIFQVDNTY